MSSHEPHENPEKSSRDVRQIVGGGEEKMKTTESSALTLFTTPHILRFLLSSKSMLDNFSKCSIQRTVTGFEENPYKVGSVNQAYMESINFKKSANEVTF
jgi:hypothetical protein